MDVDLVVAWWLLACLEGDMAREQLAPALKDLDDQLPAGDVATERPRLRRLIERVGEVDLEGVAVWFLGRHPAEVVAEAGPPPGVDGRSGGPCRDPRAPRTRV